MGKGPNLNDVPTGPTPAGKISPGVGMQDYKPQWQNFLPSDPSASATLTNSPVPPRGGAGILGKMLPQGSSQPPGGPGMGGGMLQLQMPSDEAFSHMGPMFRQQAQMVVDGANAGMRGGPPPGMRMMPGSAGPPGGGNMAGQLENYLRGREQLAAIMNRGMNFRHGGGGGRGGGGYTTSGSAGVHGGPSSASKGGLT